MRDVITNELLLFVLWAIRTGVGRSERELSEKFRWPEDLRRILRTLEDGDFVDRSGETYEIAPKGIVALAELGSEESSPRNRREIRDIERMTDGIEEGSLVRSTNELYRAYGT